MFLVVNFPVHAPNRSRVGPLMIIGGVTDADFRFVNGAVDAIIGNQAFQNGRYHICLSLGLDKVETGYNLLME